MSTTEYVTLSILVAETRAIERIGQDLPTHTLVIQVGDQLGQHSTGTILQRNGLSINDHSFPIKGFMAYLHCHTATPTHVATCIQPNVSAMPLQRSPLNMELCCSTQPLLPLQPPARRWHKNLQRSDYGTNGTTKCPCPLTDVHCGILRDIELS